MKNVVQQKCTYLAGSDFRLLLLFIVIKIILAVWSELSEEQLRKVFICSVYAPVTHLRHATISREETCCLRRCDFGEFTYSRSCPELNENIDALHSGK